MTVNLYKQKKLIPNTIGRVAVRLPSLFLCLNMRVGRKKFGKCLEVTKKSSTFALAFEKSSNKNGSLAQLNRAFDYGSKGCRFESCRSHKDGDATTYDEWLHFFD